MSTPPTAETDTARPHSPWAPSLALLVDAALVVAFVAIGQREHTTEDGLTGLLLTASPFLVGLLAMTVATGGLRPRSDAWRRVWPHGVAVWLGTLAVGMLLRVLWSLGGAPLAFVLVAAGSLALGLLGRRLLSTVVHRRRPAVGSREPEPESHPRVRS